MPREPIGSARYQPRAATPRETQCCALRMPLPKNAKTLRIMSLLLHEFVKVRAAFVVFNGRRDLAHCAKHSNTFVQIPIFGTDQPNIKSTNSKKLFLPEASSGLKPPGILVEGSFKSSDSRPVAPTDINLGNDEGRVAFSEILDAFLQDRAS